MDRFAVYDEHGRPLGLEDLPSERLLAGEPDPGPLLVRNVVRATGEERWLLHRCSALRDAGRRDPARRQRDRGRHRGQARRARRSGCSRRPARRSPPRWTRPSSSARSCACSSPRSPPRAAVELPDERGVPRRVTAAGDGGGGSPRRTPLRIPLRAGAEALGTLTLRARASRGGSFDARARGGDRPPRRRRGLQRAQPRRRTAIARALQHGLLPPELPEVPGWSDRRALPAGRRVQRGRRRLLRRLRGPGGLDGRDRRRRRPGRRGGRADLARPLHRCAPRPS